MATQNLPKHPILLEVTRPTIIAGPSDSKLVGTVVDLDSKSRKTYFTPDVGGIFTLTKHEISPAQINDAAYIAQVGTFDVVVAEKLTHIVGKHPDQAQLVIYMLGGRVIRTTITDGEVTPRLEQPRSSLATNAIADPTVAGAVASLVGMTAANVTMSRLPAIETAFAAALTNPAPTPPNADAGAAALVATGWAKG